MLEKQTYRLKFKLERRSWNKLHEKVKIKVMRHLQKEVEDKTWRRLYMTVKCRIMDQLKEDIK